MAQRTRRSPWLALLFIIGCTDASLIINVPEIPEPGAPGEFLTQIRPVSDIESVVLSGAGALYITQGDRTELRVRSEQTVLDHLSTTVADGELRVGFSGSFTLDHTMVLDCFLTVVSLEEIKLEGLWKVDASGLNGTPLILRVDGLGEVTLSSLDLPSLEVMHGGPGRVTASGSVASLVVDLGATGTYGGGSLISDEADVAIRSAGSATVAARDRLVAAISGIGDVYYYGDPVVTRTGNGTGQVQRIGG